MNWGAVYTRLARAFGWTWEYIDEYVTIPRLQEINEQLDLVPPIDEAFAQLLSAFSIHRTTAPATPPSPAPLPPAPDVASKPGEDLISDLVAAGIPIPAGLL